MWLFVTNTKSAWPTAFLGLLFDDERGLKLWKHNLQYMKCNISQSSPIYSVYGLPRACISEALCLIMSFGCVLFAISDCLYSLGMSCLHVCLAVSFSCHMHSQCVAMGTARYVKLSCAFTTWKCNFRQRTKGFNGTHSVKPSQFSRLLVLSNQFHKIVMTLLCAGPLAPSTVVPMQNRR